MIDSVGLPYWVTNQRQARSNEAALAKGWKATTMHRISPDHIEALDSIGFIWNPREMREAAKKRKGAPSPRVKLKGAKARNAAVVDQSLIARSAPFAHQVSAIAGLFVLRSLKLFTRPHFCAPTPTLSIS